MNRYLIITGLLSCAALSPASAADLFSSQPMGSDASSISEAISDGNNLGAASLADDCCCCQRSGWFAGGDYRLVRTHFSEAVAFATLTAGGGLQGPDLRVTGNEIKFGYQSAFAVWAGYHLNDFSDVRFSYWHLDSQASVAGAAVPGQVIVDPFGNIAPLGTAINTQSTVRLNVFDLEYLRRIEDPTWPASMQYSAGLRMANVNQFYDSNISAGGAQLSDGVFRVNWFGVGPYSSITGRLYGPNRR